MPQGCSSVPQGAVASREASRGPMASGQGHVSQPGGGGSQVALSKRRSGRHRMVLGMVARAGTRQHRTWVNHLSRALPGPPCAQGRQGCLPVPLSQAHQSLPHRPQRAPLDTEAAVSAPRDPVGFYRGVSLPQMGSGVTPRQAGDTPTPHGEEKGLSGSGAEHAQTRDCSTGPRFPAMLPLQCFPLSVVFSSFPGALRANLDHLRQQLGEGKESPGFWIRDAPGKSQTRVTHCSPAQPRGLDGGHNAQAKPLRP